MPDTIPSSSPGDPGDQYANSFGNPVEISESTLEPKNRVVSSTEQAIEVCQALEWDAERLIRNAARITALKQGAKPYNASNLAKQNKNWKTNISTGAYSTTLARVAPRLYMPLKQASTLTAAELPQGWAEGEAKSRFFQECVTEAIRSWPRWNWFVTGLAKEVVDYGFVFSAFTDSIEWRPHLVRMDRGFVPRGTEIMDPDIPFFEIMWEYKPEELVRLAKAAVDAGVEGWNKEAVAQAAYWATLPPATNVPPTEWRKWEELVAEQVWNTTYKKGYRVVQTKHLFVLESNGKVSHYILWPDGSEGNQLLYEKQDAYESMQDVVNPIVFGWGDGTIHGSWGAGHLLFDLGKMVEKIRCDMVDNLRNANKQRLQVNDPKDVNDVKMVVNDTEVIVTGAQFANNLGGTTQNVDSYITLNNFLANFMETKVGAYVPPIPMQPSDIKAAQVNAAMQKEQEINTDSIQTFLAQVAFVIGNMTKRLLNPMSTDRVAVSLREKLLTRLDDREIALLVGQSTSRSIMDFTPIAAQSKAQFAASVLGNQLFNQERLAILMAEGVPSGGTRLADYLVIKNGDQTLAGAAQRQQIQENTTLALGQDVPVVATDNHVIHMQTMKEPLVQALQSGMLPAAAAGLRHYAAHYAAAVATKTLPPEQINPEKSFIASFERELQKVAQAQQSQQQPQQQEEGGPVLQFT